MNKKIKEAWVAALRSGEYKQTHEILKRVTAEDGEDVCSYCCLGVLCDIFVKETGANWDKDVMQFDSFMPPAVVRDWAEIRFVGDFVVTVSDENISQEFVHLDVLNDKYNYTFSQIADIIEKQL